MAHEGAPQRSRVLIVEDSPDLLELWRMWLTLSGFIVDLASNGADALTRAQRERPDLVLMDLCLPVMDGFETMTRLRQAASTADIRIIALTALGTEQSAQRARSAGADVYLDKPVMPDVLLAHIQDMLRRPRGPLTEMVRERHRERGH